MTDNPNLTLVTPPSSTELPDPFNLAALRVPQNYAESVGVRKLLTTVPIRKPNPQDFVRTHPDVAGFRAKLRTIELKAERELYLVAPPLFGELAPEIKIKEVYTAINRQGVLFLWPVPFTVTDEKELEWHRSLREAAELARDQWVRVQANTDLGAYEIRVADSAMTDPTWPTESFQSIIKVAFRGFMVDSLDHPVVRRLRGQS
jgi:hypothetical protein